LTVQRLDLGKLSPDDDELVRGQIIISLLPKDGPCSGNPLAIVGPSGDVRGPSEEDTTEDCLPEGWEERRTDNGRIYYVNHATKSTQWDRPRAGTKSPQQRQQQQLLLLQLLLPQQLHRLPRPILEAAQRQQRPRHIATLWCRICRKDCSRVRICSDHTKSEGCGM